MHLAETDEFKVRFELFVSFPTDEKLAKILKQEISGLYSPASMEHVSFTHDGVAGWAFFGSDEEPLHAAVKEYIKDRLMSIITHEKVWKTQHESYSDQVLWDGITIHENVEVDCFYFYDNPEWYA